MLVKLHGQHGLSHYLFQLLPCVCLWALQGVLETVHLANPASSVLLGFSTCVVAPIFEELLYRYVCTGVTACSFTRLRSSAWGCRQRICSASNAWPLFSTRMLDAVMVSDQNQNQHACVCCGARRGLLLQSLASWLPSPTAVCISAVVFAASHLYPGEFLQLAVLGGVLGTSLVAARGNLMVPTVAHMLYNAAVLLLGSLP